MKGIVSQNIEQLNEISARLNVHLNSVRGLKYVAFEYGQPFQHPTQRRYALGLIEIEPYYTHILEVLTESERKQIVELTNDWFINGIED